MNAIDVIKRDHRAAETLANRYKAATINERGAMEHEILDALSAHEKMEDDCFYPALDDLLKDDATFRELKREQTELKVVIAGLRVVPFLERTHMLESSLDKVLEHAKKEETHILPRAEQHLSESALHEMGGRMEPLSAVARAAQERQTSRR